MHFTLVFEESVNYDGPQLTAQLVFHAAPVWMFEGKYVVSQNEGPHHQQGCFTQLLEAKDGLRSKLHDPSMKDGLRIFVICHQGGHGTDEDLSRLLQDLEGYDVKLVRTEKS